MSQRIYECLDLRIVYNPYILKRQLTKARRRDNKWVEFLDLYEP